MVMQSLGFTMVLGDLFERDIRVPKELGPIQVENSCFRLRNVILKFYNTFPTESAHPSW